MTNTPFIGLRPFGEEDHDRFFSREHESEVLFNIVFSTPLTLVFAPSGVGKSSLLQAGLVPRLRESRTFSMVTVDEWHPPFAGHLQQMIREHFPADCDEGSWSDHLEVYATQSKLCPVLILDQLEEGLRYNDDIEAAWDEFSLIANRPGGSARVVMGIREDYLADLDGLLRRVPMVIENGLRLGRLSDAGLRRAFYQPLARTEPPFTPDEDLFGLLMADLQRPNARGRPGRAEAGYFQVVCEKLWRLDRDRPDRRVTADSYRGAGGAEGILDAYVRSKLDESLSPDELQIGYAMTRYLVRPTGAKVPMSLDDLAGLVLTEDFTVEARSMLDIDTEVHPLEREDLRDTARRVLEKLCEGDVLILRRVSRGALQEYELFHDLLAPVLLAWRERLQNETEQKLALAAEPLLELHRSAGHLAHATTEVKSDDENRRREVVRQLGDVLVKSSVLAEEPLFKMAEEQLLQFRQYHDLTVRQEAARALSRGATVRTPAAHSWQRVITASITYAILCIASTVGAAYGTAAVMNAAWNAGVQFNRVSMVVLGAVAVAWTLAYILEGFSDLLFARGRRWFVSLRAPFEPYTQSVTGAEFAAGWPLNFLVCVPPAVLAAYLAALLVLSFTFWLIVFAIVLVAVVLVWYSNAVLLL